MPMQHAHEHEDHQAYSDGYEDGQAEERARIRREEVEPLREALREMLTEAEAYEENGSRFDRERNERARAALRAADEGRIEP